MTTAPARPSTGLPALERVPGGPRTAVSSALARRLFLAAMARLDVRVEIDGSVVGSGGPSSPRMVVHRSEEFFARIGRDGLIGFGEAYMTRAWDTDEPLELARFLTVPAARIQTLVPEPLQRLRRLVVHRPPTDQRSTRDNSRSNISHHYDLSNDLFGLFLDETLSYSSALFEAPATPGPGVTVAADPAGTGESLASAQARKIERLLDLAGVVEGTEVLEIGTGWGELALRAAQRGARVHSITLSTEQMDLARRRIDEAGVADLVTVELLDYRDLPAQGRRYDAVVSVEMIEAVGHEFWNDYFETIDAVLAPGGRVALQAITMPHDRMLATRNTHTWINKYIFPGGFLPSTEAIEQVTRDRTSLRVTDRLSFGRHYAETLRRWDATFLSRRQEILDLGFDDMFMRIWHFYLAYSQAGFASDYIDVQQILLERESR